MNLSDGAYAALVLVMMLCLAFVMVLVWLYA